MPVKSTQKISDDGFDSDQEEDKYVSFDLRDNHFIHSLDRRHLKMKSSSGLILPKFKWSKTIKFFWKTFLNS